MSANALRSPPAAPSEIVALGTTSDLVRRKLERQLVALRAPVFEALLDTTRVLLGASTALLSVHTGGRYWTMDWAGLKEVGDAGLCAFLDRVSRVYDPLVLEDVSVGGWEHGGERQDGRAPIAVGLALRKSNGQPIGFLCAFGDISAERCSDSIVGTLRKLGQAAFATADVEICQSTLDDQSSLLQATLDNVDQGISAYDQQDRLIAWNSKMSELMELPPELIHFGTRLEDVILDFARRGVYGPGDPEVLAQSAAARHRSLGSYQKEITLPNKRIVQVGVVRLPSGGFVATHKDVTEQRQQAARLQVAAKRFKLEGRIAAIANEASRFAEALASTVSGLCHELGLDTGRVFLAGPGGTELIDVGISHGPLDAPGMSGEPSGLAVTAAASGQPARNIELAAVTRRSAASIALPFQVLDAQYVIECRGRAAVPDGVVEADLCAVVGQQLTRVAERERLQQLKEEFISTVNHEMRTPLTVIAGILDLLGADLYVDQPEETKAMITVARENTQRLGALINDVLDLDGIERGVMAFDLTPFRLRTSIKSAIASEASSAAEKDVNVRLDDPESLIGLAHPMRLTQVVRHLLSNAIKFSPAGATVLITLQRFGERIRLSIADNGTGIPEAFRAHMFDKFTQADSSDTRGANGTGLGLTIVKEIVERLRGELRYESYIGEGTTFHIDLLPG